MNKIFRDQSVLTWYSALLINKPALDYGQHACFITMVFWLGVGSKVSVQA